MRIVADESVDWPIVRRLRHDGHDVTAIVEACPGAPDEQVLDTANSQNAIRLTAARDFGELVFRLGEISARVVLTRLAGLGPEAKLRLVSDVFKNRGRELRDAFTVLTPGIVRVRSR